MVFLVSEAGGLGQFLKQLGKEISTGRLTSGHVSQT